MPCIVPKQPNYRTVCIHVEARLRPTLGEHNMLSVDEALQLVLDQARPLGSQEVYADCALGLRLAEPIVSDIDSPPHDKSIVDGYAVIAADIASTDAELLVLEEVTAGNVPTRVVEPGTATRIMTGAPIPAGADAIVMVEQTALAGPDRVRIQAAVRAGQNIVRRGACLTTGQTVLLPGKRIRAIEAGLLAEVGRTHVLVDKWPSVAVLATGNELVDRSQQPGAGQIRNSNGLLLRELAAAAGADAYEPMGPARDNKDDLTRCIEPGLSHDILLVSGGVSAGVLDLVPTVLADLGVEQVFHKVNLKPGKPLWFGVKRHPEQSRQTLVFGLPGNPVSGLVCFELFVRPAIEKLSGREPRGLSRTTAALTQEHRQRGDRPTYWPAVMRSVDARFAASTNEFLTAPLTAIIGFGERLELAKGLDEAERRLPRGIVEAGQTLKQIMEELLALAKNREQETTASPPAIVTPLPWQGSGDLRTLADANCLAYFPAGYQTFPAGAEVEVLLLG